MNTWEWIFVILILVFFLVILITVCVIALTTGFKKTGRMSGGLYCLTAPPSSGKTYVASQFAHDFMKQGRRVFTNYPVVYNDGREYYESCALTKDMLLKQNFNGSVLIIDEAHNWFWSRKFKEFTEDYKIWFSTLSQHEISLYYIVQHEDRVDTIINDCCTLFGEISKIEIPILDMPLYFTITWWNREIDMQQGRFNDRVQPYHVERVWFNKDVANSFDTKWFGTDRRPEYEGIGWVKWLKEKYDMDYKGNYDFSLKSQVLNKLNALMLNRIKGVFSMVSKGVLNGWSQLGARFDRDKDHEDELTQQEEKDYDELKKKLEKQQIDDLAELFEDGDEK